MLQIQSK